MDIGPGDFVECVGPCGCPDADFTATDLVKGAVYRCTEVGHDGHGGPAIWLAEFPNPSDCFCPGHFRPIRRPKSGAFDDLLKVPDLVGEPA
jgi:hypothetical protein